MESQIARLRGECPRLSARFPSEIFLDSNKRRVYHRRRSQTPVKTWNAIRRRAKRGNDIMRRCHRVFVKRDGQKGVKTEETHHPGNERKDEMRTCEEEEEPGSRAVDVMDPARPNLPCPVQTKLMLLLNYHRQHSAIPAGPRLAVRLDDYCIVQYSITYSVDRLHFLSTISHLRWITFVLRDI